MEQSSWEASQQIRHILRNAQVHCRIHNGPPLIPVLCHITPIYVLSSFFCKINLIVSSHLRLCLPSGLFPSCIPTKTICTFFSPHTCHMHRPSYPWFDHPHNIWWVRIMKLLMQFPSVSCNSLLSPNIFLSTLFSSTLGPYSFLYVPDHCWQ